MCDVMFACALFIDFLFPTFQRSNPFLKCCLSSAVSAEFLTRLSAVLQRKPTPHSSAPLPDPFTRIIHTQLKTKNARRTFFRKVWRREVDVYEP